MIQTLGAYNSVLMICRKSDALLIVLQREKNNKNVLNLATKSEHVFFFFLHQSLPSMWCGMLTNYPSTAKACDWPDMDKSLCLRPKGRTGEGY